MTVVSIGNFQTSELKKMVNPNPNISENIRELERIFFELELYDEVKELFGSPFSQIVYKKNGEEVFVIGLNKTNYYLKLSGYKWDFAPFLLLPVEKEFSIDKTLSWKILDLERVELSKLGNAIKESIDNSKDLVQLIRFILIVISAFISKASYLNEDAIKLNAMVFEHFWKGELNVISELYEKSTHSKGEHFNIFVKKWKEQLNYNYFVDARQFSTEMNLDRFQLLNLIKTIHAYLNQSTSKYIHSIKNLWFDMDMIQDELKFNERVKEIRTKILLAQNYLHDMERLLSKEESEIEQLADHSNKSEPSNAILQFLYDKVDSSTTFLTKEDLFVNNPTLVINENMLDKLAATISNGNKNKKEYINLIRVIFNKSLTKGFTVKEIVQTFFISKYDNESERKDFEQRYDVKRLFVKSTLENVFETIMERLIELNIIKKELCLIQAKQQEKITFNYNIQIYEAY